MKKKLSVKEIVDRLPKSVRLEVAKNALIKADSQLERHLIIQQIKEESGQSRSATIYLSRREVDHDGDIVTPTGWNLLYYTMNPKGLWGHNTQMPPIFKANWTKPDEYGLLQNITFAETEFAEDMWQLVKGGFLNTFSAGFMSTKSLMADHDGFKNLINTYKTMWPEFNDEAVKQTRRIITEKILFESSLCNVPANPYALVVALHDGEMKISDDTRKALCIEEYIQKGIDEGKLDKSMAHTPVKPEAKQDKADDAQDDKPADKVEEKKEQTPAPEKVEQKKEETKLEINHVLEVKKVLSIKAVPPSVSEIVAAKVEKIICKKRGAV